MHFCALAIKGFHPHLIVHLKFLLQASFPQVLSPSEFPSTHFLKNFAHAEYFHVEKWCKPLDRGREKCSPGKEGHSLNDP